ncbi:MAG: LUD domain-containing protein [Chitinophagales bacterium]|nr:LUD domain-containing protein [Bacteroidota bacterium]MCB9042274.1 LUD domain-containing protein [Chitinophagales bacterium]
MSSAKENILHNIRAHQQQFPLAKFHAKSPETATPLLEKELLFAENFLAQGGTIIFCDNAIDFGRKMLVLNESRAWDNVYCWDREFAELLIDYGLRTCRIGKKLYKPDACITFSSALIAESGSVLFNDQDSPTEGLFALAPTQIIVAYTSDIVTNLEEALARNKNPHQFVLANQSAHTTLMGNRWLKGGMGPDERILFLIHQENF